MALLLPPPADVLSTTETLTPRVWIDGRPIWRKVIDFGALPGAASQKSLPHGLGSASLVSLSGMSSAGLPLPYASPTAAECVAVLVEGPNLTVRSGPNLAAQTARFVLEFVK